MERKLPKGVEVFEVTEPFSFVGMHRYWTVIQMVGGKPKGLILVLSKILTIEQSHWNLFKAFCQRCYKEKVRLVLIGVQPRVLNLIQTDELYDLIGPQNIVKDLESAIQKFDSKDRHKCN